MDIYDSLQLREIFHFEFLRWIGKKIKAENYVLKGGVNLRFFFNSFRYSEDMDLDIRGVNVNILKDIVMKILETPSFTDTLNPFGIERIIPPDISRAKQTETAQRFKIHLITSSGDDLFTKVEFSRRGFQGEALIQAVSDVISRSYKMAPLLLPHYEIQSAIMQKIAALASRSIIQSRDVFDLYILHSQYSYAKSRQIKKLDKLDIDKFKKAQDNIFEISFKQFRDTVLNYLAPEDQAIYKTTVSWDEMKLKVANFIDELKEKHA